MGSFCSGSDDAEISVEAVVDSQEVGEISIPCTEDKIMYIYPLSDGFLVVLDESDERQSLPQFLKVKVDGARSCRGERYYFEIMEGPYVKSGAHWDVRYRTNNWSVSKTYRGKSTLIEENPHLGAFDLEVIYTGFSPRSDDVDGNLDGIRIAQSLSHGEIAVASISGEMTFNAKKTIVRMELDIIQPNVSYNVSIPDTVHEGGENYLSGVPKAMVWMRIDAETSPVAWSNKSVGNDRYLHFGNGSAGCFTNRPETQDVWNEIIDDLTRSRVGPDGLYVGTIKLTMSPQDYEAWRVRLSDYAKNAGVKYIWNNEVHTP